MTAKEALRKGLTDGIVITWLTDGIVITWFDFICFVEYISV